MNNRPLNISCSIPFCVDDEPGKYQYYCKTIFSILKNGFICGTNPCGTSTAYGKCNLGKKIQNFLQQMFLKDKKVSK